MESQSFRRVGRSTLSYSDFLNVPGGQTLPNNVRNIGRTVIEHVHTNPVIKGTREKCVAGAYAGAHDAEVFISLLLLTSRNRRECR